VLLEQIFGGIVGLILNLKKYNIFLTNLRSDDIIPRVDDNTLVEKK